MKVPGISTSPRREGNSDLLLRQALSGAREVGSVAEYLRLCHYRIEGCRERYNCSTMGYCSTKDGYQPILDKMLAADRLILATPCVLHDCLGAGFTSPSAAPVAESSSIASGSPSNPASSTLKWIIWAACASTRWMKKGQF